MPFSGLSQGSFSAVFEEQRMTSFLEFSESIITTFLKIMPDSCFEENNFSSNEFENRLRSINILQGLSKEEFNNKVSTLSDKVSEDFFKLLIQF